MKLLLKVILTYSYTLYREKLSLEKKKVHTLFTLINALGVNLILLILEGREIERGVYLK